MNFFKIILITIFLIFSAYSLQADNHDQQQNIVDKAKEINQKVKKQQALKEAGIKSEVGEEPLPLNDPFVGDGSLGGSSGGVKVIAETEEEKRNLSVFNFKLVGVIGSSDDLYASMIDENGEILTLGLFEELSPGIKLVGVNTKEVVFERDGGSLVAINFKNQIIERAK